MPHSYFILMLADMCVQKSEFQIAYRYEAKSDCFKSVFHVRILLFRDLYSWEYLRVHVIQVPRKLPPYFGFLVRFLSSLYRIHLVLKGYFK